MDSFLASGTVPPASLRPPARLPMAAARASMSLGERYALGRNKQSGYSKRAGSPPTILQQRAAQQVYDAARSSARPPVFTAEFIEAQDPKDVASILNACFYDLVDLEKSHAPAKAAPVNACRLQPLYAKLQEPKL